MLKKTETFTESENHGMIIQYYRLERHGMSMMKWKNWEEKRMLSDRELPFLLLLIAGVMEFVFITMESLFSYIGYYLVEDYIIIPCMLFVGIAMMRKLSPVAKSRMLLAVATIAWFTLVQMIHKMSGMGTHPIGTVFFVYLMAFPFAYVTEDHKNRGLNLICWIFIAAAMMQTLYTVLLLLDCVPAIMKPFVYWDGARLHVFWHPNITACFFMIGIGFAVSLFFRTEKQDRKVFLALIIFLQFAAMALTNCRTTLLMTSALFGSIGFFLINQGGWKRFVAGLTIAVVTLVVSFWVSGKIFAWHNDVLLAQITQQLEERTTTASGNLEAAGIQDEVLSSENVDADVLEISGASGEIPLNYTVNAETGEVKIVSQNGQGTLSNDMRTLNGRIGIWKASLAAVRDNRTIALWGTEYVSSAISPYDRLESVHTHNSWMETLLRLGLPGLLLALIFTWISARSAWVLVWNQHVELWRKMIAVLTLCVMVAGFLEPYLFITNVYYHVTDFIFFFCTGYLDYWRKQLLAEKM